MHMPLPDGERQMNTVGSKKLKKKKEKLLKSDWKFVNTGLKT